MLKGQQRVGVEFKRSDAPTFTRSMRVAMEDLKLDALYVVFPGMHRHKLDSGVEAVPLWALLPNRLVLRRGGSWRRLDHSR